MHIYIITYTYHVHIYVYYIRVHICTCICKYIYIYTYIYISLWRTCREKSQGWICPVLVAIMIYIVLVSSVIANALREYDDTYTLHKWYILACTWSMIHFFERKEQFFPHVKQFTKYKETLCVSLRSWHASHIITHEHWIQPPKYRDLIVVNILDLYQKMP